MDKKYIFLAVLVITLGIVVAVLPERDNTKEMYPEDLLLELNDESRFFSTDDVADWMVKQDPGFVLIDVRTPEEYEKYSLPGAINIPLKDILNEEWEPYLNQDVRKNVFYSNGTVYASQAWILCRRLSYQNNYIMKGGLNRWVETILRPQMPPATAPQQEFDLYQFRKAASAFFGGGTAAPAGDDKPAKKKMPTFKKKAAQEESGGC